MAVPEGVTLCHFKLNMLNVDKQTIHIGKMNEMILHVLATTKSNKYIHMTSQKLLAY